MKNTAGFWSLIWPRPVINQGHLQIWMEYSHIDLWKSDTSREHHKNCKSHPKGEKNIHFSITKELVRKTRLFFIGFHSSTFVKFVDNKMFLITLLVSDFQRSLWESSVHICSCPCINHGHLYTGHHSFSEKWTLWGGNFRPKLHPGGWFFWPWIFII